MYKLSRFVGAKEIVETAIAKRVEGMNTGTINYENVAEAMEILEPFEIFKSLMDLQNKIGDFWMPFINLFVEDPEEAKSKNVITEVYENLRAETSTLRGDSKTGEVEERSIMIPVSNKEVKKRWVSRNWQRNPLGVLSDIPMKVSQSFRNVELERFLAALLIKPADSIEDPMYPCLYRDTSGFAAENQIVPFPHGLKTFTNAESHYLFATSVGTENLAVSRRKVQSKGYGTNGLFYIASESYWDEMAALATWSDEVKSMFELSNEFFDSRGMGRRGDMYIKVPDVYMPGDDVDEFYLITIDPNVKTLRRVSPDDAETAAVRPLTTNVANLEIISEIRFIQEGVGLGVQQRGSAAVMYIKAGATEYVNPSVKVY